MARRLYRNPLFHRLSGLAVKDACGTGSVKATLVMERLLESVDPTASYPLEYLSLQLLGRTFETPCQESVSGRDLAHDLRLMIEDVSAAVGLERAEVGEPAFTIDQLATRCHVVTKTIRRWVQRGLVGRYLLVDGRLQLCFLQSTVDRYVSRHAERVRRSGNFSRLTAKERAAICAEADRLMASGLSLAVAVRIIHAATKRCKETIRGLIRRHRRGQVAPADASPETAAWGEMRDRLLAGHRHGKDIATLANETGLSRQVVETAIREERWRRIRELPLTFFFDPVFNSPAAAAQLLGPLPAAASSGRGTCGQRPTGLPSYLASLYETPLLDRQQERHLFLKFNYLKSLCAQLREKVDPHRLDDRLLAAVEQTYEKVIATKNELITANLRLVVSLARKARVDYGDFFELVSDGNMSLIRAVDKFDVSRNNKFSTYASWAILRDLRSRGYQQARDKTRFQTGCEEHVFAVTDERGSAGEQEAAHYRRQRRVREMLDLLDDRERKILEDRFGLNDETEELTLEQVGNRLRVSKERARQLQARALEKLRRLTGTCQPNGQAP